MKEFHNKIESLMGKTRLDIKENKKNIICFSVILLFIIIYFAPVFFKGKIFFPDLLLSYRPWSVNERTERFIFSHLKSDLVDSYFPQINWIKQELANGNLPLWNNLIDFGKPFIFFLIPNLFFPLHIFIWILPTDIGFTLYILSKLILGGIGMFLWLRNLKLSRSVSLISSIVFIFSCFNIVWLFGNEVTINLMTPWLFLAIDKFLARGRPKLISVIALIIGGMILTGFVAGAAYVIYLSSFYVLILIISKSNSKFYKKEYIIQEIWKVFKKGILWLFTVGLAASLAAILLFPSLEMLSFVNIEYRKELNSATHLPIVSLLQILFPNYWGNPVLLNWEGSSNWNETSSFIGIISLSLAIISPLIAIRRKSIKIITFSLLSVFCFLVIYGITPLLSLIRQLPIFDSSSNTRLLGVFSFLLITISAYSLNVLLSKKHKKEFISFLLGFIVLLLPFLYKSVILLLSSGLRNLRLFDISSVRFFSVLFELGSILAFFISVVLFFKNRLKLKEIVFITLTLTFVDLFFFGLGHVPMVGRNYFYPKTGSIKFLEQNLNKDDRILPFDGMFMISGTQIFYGFNTPVTHNLHTIREKDLLSKFIGDAWMSDTAPGLKSEETDFHSPLMDLYGIKYTVVAPSTLLDETAQEQTKSDKVIEEIYGSKYFSQSIYIQENQKINRACFQFANYKEEKVGKTEIVVRNELDQKVFSTVINNKEVIDNSYACIYLNKESFPTGQYYFDFSAPDVDKQNAITLWGSTKDIYPEGYLKTNAGNNLDVKDLAFKLFFEDSNPKWNNVYYNSEEVSIYENLNYNKAPYWITLRNYPLENEKDFLSNIQEVTDRNITYYERQTEDINSIEDNDTYSANISVLEENSDYIKLKVCSDEPGILNTRDSYFPGWQAYVNGKQTDILQTNYIFRGIQIPTGCNIIEQRFYPQSFKSGVIISAASLGIILLLLLIDTRVGKRFGLLLALPFKRKGSARPSRIK